MGSGQEYDAYAGAAVVTPTLAEVDPEVAGAVIAQAIEHARAAYFARLRTLREEAGSRMRSVEQRLSVPESRNGTPADRPRTAPAPAQIETVRFDRTAALPPEQHDLPEEPPQGLHAHHDRSELGTEAHDARFFFRLGMLLAICCAALLAGVLVRSLVAGRAADQGTDRPVAQAALPVRGASERSDDTASGPTAQPAATTILQQATTTPAPATPQPATPAPSAAPTTAPAMQAPDTTDALPPAMRLLQHVAAAEAELRTGQVDATIDYRDGSRSSAQVRFDLGDDRHVPRFHITSTYDGPSGAQTIERITIGSQSWQREREGSWSARAVQEGVRDQVQVFLPHAALVSNPAQLQAADVARLSWYDASRDADVTLVLDPATGIPRELRQATRATGMVMTLIYRGWNTAVEIAPPAL